ncbi:MAG: ABC transporter permease [Myxococcota bacterium]
MTASPPPPWGLAGLRTLGWMARKELLRFVADPAGAVLTFLVPILLAVLMSSVFAPRDFVDPLPLVVAAVEPGPHVRTLIDRLDANPAVIVRRASPDDARAQVFSGEAAAALILPGDAERALQPLSLFAGDPVPVEVLLDPSRATEVDILEGLVTREVMQQLSAELATDEGRTHLFRQIGLLTATSPGLSAAAKARWAAFSAAGVDLATADAGGSGTTASGARGSPLDLQRRTLDVFNPKARWNAYAHYFAGMLTMSLLFLAATAALNLVQEREEGALARVRMSGAHPVLALVGGAMGTMFVALVTACAVFASGVAVFDIPVGSVPGLLAMLLSLSALVGGFSLLLASVGQTARQISIMGPFVILVMGFLGGSAVPTFIMPDYVRTLSIFLPTTWANEGLAAATWRGAPTLVCFEWASGVLAFSLVFGLIGALSFRWSR